MTTIRSVTLHHSDRLRVAIGLSTDHNRLGATITSRSSERFTGVWDDDFEEHYTSWWVWLQLHLWLWRAWLEVDWL